VVPALAQSDHGQRRPHPPPSKGGFFGVWVWGWGGGAPAKSNPSQCCGSAAVPHITGASLPWNGFNPIALPSRREAEARHWLAVADVNTGGHLSGCWIPAEADRNPFLTVPGLVRAANTLPNDVTMYGETRSIRPWLNTRIVPDRMPWRKEHRRPSPFAPKGEREKCAGPGRSQEWLSLSHQLMAFRAAYSLLGGDGLPCLERHARLPPIDRTANANTSLKPVCGSALPDERKSHHMLSHRPACFQ